MGTAVLRHGYFCQRQETLTNLLRFLISYLHLDIYLILELNLPWAKGLIGYLNPGKVIAAEEV